MTSPLSRLVAHFVAPADPPASDAPPACAAPVDAALALGHAPSVLDVTADRDAAETRRRTRRRVAARAFDTVAVLAQPADAAAAGGAVALAIARGPVVVLLWGAAPGHLRAPASPPVRRLARRLAERGHRAGVTGRLALVALGEGIDEAVRVAAAASVPAVLVVAGPRDDRVDAVLAGQERAVAVGEGALPELAAQSVASLGVPARTLALPAAPAARTLAATGVRLAAPLRAPVTEALR